MVPRSPLAVAARAGAHGFLLPLVGAPLRVLAEVVVEWEESLPPGEVLDTLRTERGMSGRVQGRNVQLKCTRRQCTYSGERQYDELAIELAKAALAGKPEYRLTS